MKPAAHALGVLGLAAQVCSATSAMRMPPTAPRSSTLKLPHVTITLAEPVAAGAFKLPGGGGMGAPGGLFATLPAFCRVAATAKPTADSDIRFEVWLPLEDWNGKFVGGGNGVWAGSIAYGDMTGPLAANYATAASDLGHQGSPMDGNFVVGPSGKAHRLRLSRLA